jgi:hypothetical protein
MPRVVACSDRNKSDNTCCRSRSRISNELSTTNVNTIDPTDVINSPPPPHEVLSTYIVHIKCTVSSLGYVANGPELGTEMTAASRDGCHILLLGVVCGNMPAWATF